MLVAEIDRSACGGSFAENGRNPDSETGERRLDRYCLMRGRSASSGKLAGKPLIAPNAGDAFEKLANSNQIFRGQGEIADAARAKYGVDRYVDGDP